MSPTCVFARRQRLRRPIGTHGTSAFASDSREGTGRRDDRRRRFPEVVGDFPNELVAAAREAQLPRLRTVGGQAAAAREAQLPLKPGVILS